MKKIEKVLTKAVFQPDAQRLNCPVDFGRRLLNTNPQWHRETLSRGNEVCQVKSVIGLGKKRRTVFQLVGPRKHRQVEQLSYEQNPIEGRISNHRNLRTQIFGSL